MAAQTRVVDFKRLSPSSRERLLDELAEVYAQLFDMERAEARSFVREFQAEDRFIGRAKLFYSRENRLVGFMQMVVTRIQVGSRSHYFATQAAAFKPEFRGEYSSRQSFFVWENVKFFFRTLTQSSFLKIAFIHPATFHGAARHFHECYPSPRTPRVPDRYREIYDACFSGQPRADAGSHLYVSRTPLRPRGRCGELELRKAVELARDRPYVQFFLDHNPRFHEGWSLNVMVPMSFGNLARTLATYLLFRGRQRLR